MASPTTQRMLSEIKSKMGICPQLEENGMKMLHMNNPLGGWREWMILSYDQNLLGDMLQQENKALKKKIEELEKMIKMMTCPPMYPPMAAWPFSNPLVQTMSLEVDGEDDNKDGSKDDE